MPKLNSQDIKKIKDLRTHFPEEIEVEVSVAEEGGYLAEVITFPGCRTQADTFSELIGMVNDAVATVLEIPEEYLPFMPTYMPPVSLAQRLSIFPTVKVANEIVTFSLVI